MRTITVSNSVTLDGVMQAPGRPDEDRRDGFEHGGWANPYFDKVMIGRPARRWAATRRCCSAAARTRTSHGSGRTCPRTTRSRRSSTTPASTWSRTACGAAAWRNSTLHAGDGAEAVATLKAGDGPDLVILGSGELIRSLIGHDLIDEIRLLIHPLVLGSGRRMFDDGLPLTRFALADSTPTTTGVIIARYRLTHEPPNPDGAQQAELAGEAVAKR